MEIESPRPKVGDYIDVNNNWIYILKGTPKTQDKDRPQLTEIDKYGPCSWCNTNTPSELFEHLLTNELMNCRWGRASALVS
jgi:hypothetical protein